MTSLLVAFSLILTPSPIQAPQHLPGGGGETVQQRVVGTSALLDPIVNWTDSALTLSFDGPPPTTTTIPPPPVIYPPTPMELVDQIFGWPGAQLVACESSWNRFAVGRYGERGLFQIHPVHRYGIVARLGYTWDDMFEVEPNIRVALEIRYEQGLRAWTCWRG